MVENLLTKAIRSYLAIKLKDFLLPCEDPEKGKSLQIINGYLPPKTTKEKVSDEDLYPFVLVRPESAETDRESTVVTVAIIIGTYSKESIGHEYALNVMTRIWQIYMQTEWIIRSPKPAFPDGDIYDF